ncbi:hypothetical protein A3A95_01755 [Candidatus Nomurabacteria bacterium RIFCSPLOWO2_01_FULL_39_18]|uniref:Cell shape-determining protein MreC n=1 Tax=Candidatus Nomurabacteria bacterium RIFCSPHIGHO2_01_FULL_40_24b TaxID=1801739 RepID=A0A1F6V9J7_9BACT|nr:MAG: hypothetical protein A2647_00965 [Candidatus Nomurabacteria bacterium RIFCSPHIGHO2_01_FULL_40_24b]OGI90591.1 MAG: hypothetical protein A3A95_01755 [Candidatus Nomurabacteria bacterium RIFCSPLOWO2_01_FULL_39_18]
MNYLQDRKSKKKEFSYTFFFVILFSVLFYFRMNIFHGLAYVSSTIFRPVVVFGNSVRDKLGDISYFFTSKNSLIEENEDLRTKLRESEAELSNYNSILEENSKLKEILGRKREGAPMILAAILSRPNQSVYDTLVIDVGTKQGLQVGDKVFASGFVPIGRVREVYGSSSKVVLFSSSGEKTNITISLDHNIAGEFGEITTTKDVSMEIVGRGGGNFEMILPRDFFLKKGDQAVLPGIMPHVVGVVEAIISDPRDSFQKALLVSPVNIQELKFVEVEMGAR